MGFISTAECEIMHNNVLINTHMIHNAVKASVERYFFSSSVCVYKDMQPGDPELYEDDVIPAEPDNEYGWEKLYAERMALAYARNKGIKTRVARFQNTYGPEGTWQGGREKAPAAISRKVAQAENGGAIEVWGDGTAIRSYTYVDDLVRGIYLLMQSDLEVPANIGSTEYVSVDELAQIVIDVSGKDLGIKHVDGPVGVQSRNFSNERINSLGWRHEYSLLDGMRITYKWVEEQVRKAGS
jgi:nucleoside-diphosphate-sugar epimerase